MADYHEDNASFMMYKEWEDLFLSLDSNDERAALIMAIFAFASRNEVPDFQGALKIAFLMVSKQLDRDGTKWEKKCERNAENVRKRWEKANADKGERIPTDTTVYESIPTDTNNTDKDKVKDKDKDKDKDKVKDKVKEKISPNAEAFEKVWAQYPKREGRKDALAAFEKAIKKGTTVEQIESGIQAYCEHIKKCNIERQYIKQGSTYFRGEHWNDVYDDSATTTAEPKKKTSYDLSKVIPAIPVN